MAVRIAFIASTTESSLNLFIHRIVFPGPLHEAPTRTTSVPLAGLKDQVMAHHRVGEQPIFPNGPLHSSKTTSTSLRVVRHREFPTSYPSPAESPFQRLTEPFLDSGKGRPKAGVHPHRALPHKPSIQESCFRHTRPWLPSHALGCRERNNGFDNEGGPFGAHAREGLSGGCALSYTQRRTRSAWCGIHRPGIPGSHLNDRGPSARINWL